MHLAAKGHEDLEAEAPSTLIARIEIRTLFYFLSALFGLFVSLQ